MATNKLRPSKQKEISTNNYIILVTIGALTALLVGGYFGIRLLSENFKNGRVIAGKLQAQRELDTKLENAKKLVENYENLSPGERKLIDSALPASTDFPQVISLVESAAVNAGIRVKSINTQPEGVAQAPAAAGLAKSYIFSLDVEGPYSKMTQFYKNLELSARPMKVSAFQLRGTTGTLVGSITIQTFYQDKADLNDKEEVVK
ncbi:MAG TPA: type 4a pilus biogenesis protein PilO [Candidatus Dormibacteraeota bacterium]|nr:type 4a pilus biogenesis protein PilO [Candidatus Dormibacteraeota bacterium]